MILRTSAVPLDPERHCRARLITVFAVGCDWLVKGDATSDLGRELKRFGSRAEAMDYARNLAARTRPCVISVEAGEALAA